MLATVGACLLGAPGAAAALPTPAQLDRATDRFLEHHRPAPALDRAPGGGIDGSPLDILPDGRVVAFYGAPQMGATVLGLNSPRRAATKLARQSAPYEKLGARPVLGAFDLVSVFATAGGGPDDLYRTRQDPEIIDIYLEQARSVGARLILDIQPGRSTFLEELEVLRPWLIEPDVDLALDPEWNVGPRGVPGQTDGAVKAREVNRVARALAQIVRTENLPPKLLLVHQFRRGSIKGRSKITTSADVQTVLNFDGIGSPGAKMAGYAALSVPTLFDGFSLFYQRDTPLLKPGAVLALEPEPDFLLYQ